jgi:hypothetical protein
MSSTLPIPQDPTTTLTVVPSPPTGSFKNRVIVFFLQLSHRLGAIALLSTIGTWAMMYMIRDFHLPLAIASGCADAGLCSALIARIFTRPTTPSRREANGVAIFNLVLFILAVYLMIFARLDVIRAAASEFFTPTPQAAVHG